MEPEPEPEHLFPKNTFDISKEYNPESMSDAQFQSVQEAWPKAGLGPLRPLLMDDISQAIGYTPLVRLNKVPQSEGAQAEVCKLQNA